jgi:hypothetical protein
MRLLREIEDSPSVVEREPLIPAPSGNRLRPQGGASTQDNRRIKRKRMHCLNQNRSRTGLTQWSFVLLTVLVPVCSYGQYKGDHIPGFIGLEAGTQAPPGLYLANVIWVYPTNTVKDNSGNAVTLPGSLTSTADIILVNVATNYKLFGANVGGSGAFPFIKNRIQFNSLDVSTGFAYTDMFVNGSLGWKLKRADILAGYNLYIPTGRFSATGTNNTGLGIWGNEFTIGSTVYLDQKNPGTDGTYPNSGNG